MTVYYARDAKDFARILNAYAQMTAARERLLYKRVFEHIKRSILDGSELTGAPGQPIEWGDLYRSWKDEGSLEERMLYFVSRLIYAKIIENNFRGATLRSVYGGFHSVKLTRLAFRRIVQHELAIVKRAIPDINGVGSSLRDPVTGRFV